MSNVALHHNCWVVTETVRMTNYAKSFGAINVQKTHLEVAEMILDPWNQQNVTFKSRDTH